MQEYDVALKLALREPAEETLRALFGAPVVRWLNIELPEVRAARVDLLGQIPNGDLVHIELQSTNDPQMALRMAEYCLSVYRQFGKLPLQVVLYVGESPISMPRELAGRDVSFRHRQVDIRELDGERLLASEHMGDNVIAILAGLRDRGAAVRQVVAKIAGLDPKQRTAALSELMILAGLRRLDTTVQAEVNKVPILNSILDHEVLGREHRKGAQEALVAMLHEQLGERFGPLPGWVAGRLAVLSESELRELGVRLLKAQSLDELLR